MNELSKTYEEFISQFPVYNTYKEAKARGFEAHHIVPICTQKGCSRENPEDDRCVRLTAYEHILAHYLYCKDHPENIRAFTAFNSMVNLHGRELQEDESFLVEKLPSFADMRMRGYENVANYMRSREVTEDTRKKLSEAAKGRPGFWTGKKRSEEDRARMSEAAKGRPAPNKGKPSPLKGKPFSEEHKKGISTGLKLFYQKNEPPAKGCKHSEEAIKRTAEGHFKTVYERDRSGNIIEIFKSVNDAKKTLKLGSVIYKYLREGTPEDFQYSLSYN